VFPSEYNSCSELIIAPGLPYCLGSVLNPDTSLDRGVSYQDFGGNYFDEHDRQTVEKRLIRHLAKLGYQVSLEPGAQIA
jgi:hypothetical protein